MELVYKPATLVYSSFDENGAIPNGYDIYTEHRITYFSGNGYFVTHLNDPFDIYELPNPTENRKLQINTTSLDSLNPTGTNFFVIGHACVSYEVMASDRFVFPDKLINSIKNNNLYLTLLHEHESCTENGFKQLCEKLKFVGIPLSKVILINNNSKLYEYKEKYGYDIKVHHSNFLYFSFTKTLDMLNSNWVENKTGKFFMCRNRNPKPHRVSLLAKLYVNDLIGDFNYSYIPNTGYKENDFVPYESFFDQKYIHENKDFFNFISTNKKLDDYEIDKNWIDLENGEFSHQKDFHPIYHIPEYSPSFENSYFNIITESWYKSEFNSIHITEKSLRPFYFYQFPIFVSTPYHIKYLKKDYNFDFFDDIINHSYDNEVDDKKRMDMIVAEIKRISNNKDFFINFYKNNRDRFEYNRNLCINRGFSGKREDLNFFWNLL